MESQPKNPEFRIYPENKLSPNVKGRILGSPVRGVAFI